MKKASHRIIFITTLLSAASSSSAAALDSVEEASSLITKNNVLSDVIVSSSEDPNDWQQQIQCTVDTSNNDQPIVDEDACKSRTDANSNSCVWCDLPQNPFVQGACISQSQKEAAGQLCSSSDGTDDASTANQAINCLNITDESVCTSTIDATTTTSSNENCMFCNFPLVGGKCVTKTLAESFVRFCIQHGEEKVGEDSIFLRGSVAEGQWRALDPSCLSDDTNNNPDDCGSKTDLNGEPCMWCDAAAGVFGECVSRSQKDFFENYLECEGNNDVMVE